MILYALLVGKVGVRQPEMMLWSLDKHRLEKRINTAYSMAKGMQPKGSSYTIDDYMANKQRVKVEITEI